MRLREIATRRARICWLGTSLLAGVAAGAGMAQAQDAEPTGPAAERVGPQAQAVDPEFRQPSEFPDFAPPPPPPIPHASGSASITGISISGGGAGAATVRSDFTSLDNPAYGLSVDALPGTALDANWVEAQFRANGLIADAVPLDRLAAMVQLVNRAFLANGYINSGLLIAGAPPSEPGPLRMRLVLGRVVRGDEGITVVWGPDGERGLTERFVTNRMPSAREVPLDVIAIERDFRLLAEDPAVDSVSADLQPGDVPGEARLAMLVRPTERFDAYIGFANSRSPSIGGERFAAGGSIRNLLTAGDIAEAEGGITAGKPDARFGYSTPVGGPHTSLFARGGFNRAAVVDPDLRPLDISASDWNVEGGFTHRVFGRPLSPRRSGDGWQSARSLTLGASLAHRVSKTRLLGRPFSFSPGAVDGRSAYTAARITADFVERGTSTVFVLSLTGTQGIDGTRPDIPGLVTPLIAPDSDFRSIRGQLSYARLLTDNNLELRVRLSGQYADGILYSGERFAAGGRQTVRGYRETLVLTDMGAVGSVELAQPFSLTKGGGDGQGLDWGAFTATVFVDGGMLDNREIADPASDRLLSIGAGLTWRPSPGFQATLVYGHALKDAVAPGQRDLQDRGIHFAITLRPLKLLR